MASAAADISLNAHANASADCRSHSDSNEHSHNLGYADAAPCFNSAADADCIVERACSFATAH